MARTILAGLVLGIVGGVAVVLLDFMFGGIVVSIALVGVGYLISEGISITANRKRGRNLKFVAAGSTLIALSIFSVTDLSMYALLSGAAAVYVAINRF